MSTIKEVSIEAGVSTATVSRVINGNYPVSQATYKKVMAAIETVGYRPNAVARSLKMNKTYMIGLVVPDISNPYFMEIARGVEEVIQPHGYTLTFCSTDELPEKEIKLLKALNERRVDFVILASSLENEKPLINLMNQGLRIIMVDTMFPKLKVDFVVENNEEASYQLVDYGLKLGHKRVGIVNGIMAISTAKDRFKGYKRALLDNGVKLYNRYIVNGGYSRDIAYQSVKSMLESNRQHIPTLLYATNNQMTEGAMIAIKEFGLKIPEDISIVSFGDITLPQLVEPKLTIIRQDAKAIGEMAGNILMKRMEALSLNGPHETCVIPSELIIRESVIKK